MTTTRLAGSLLLIHSHYGEPPDLFSLALKRNDALIVRERDLIPAHIEQARGIITTSHLDQHGFFAYRQQLFDFMARGGRWFFNGHILRPFLPGLVNYIAIPKARRADLVLTRLNEHPIFEGIDQTCFEENRGVAGFYGRGHNPLPPGALAVNGIGPLKQPIDWDWTLPGAGRMFSHAGNDIGVINGPNPNHALIAPRIIAWTMGEI